MSLRDPRRLYDDDGKHIGWEVRWRDSGRGSGSHRKRFLVEKGWTQPTMRKFCDQKLGERTGTAPKTPDVPTLDDARLAWLDDPKDIEPITVEGYDSALRLHAGPLTDKGLDQITVADIRRQMAAMSKDGRSMSRIKALRSGLAAVYQWAQDEELVAVNVASGVRLPRQPRSANSGREQDTLVADPEFVPTLEQVWDFVEAIHPIWSSIPLTIATLGPRGGEMEALDVTHWTDGQLNIEASISHVSERYLKGESRRKGPKSDAGFRTLRVPADLAGILDKASAGRTEGPLFQGPRGGRLSMNNLRNREWKDAQQKTGLHSILPHRLRHHFASRLIMEGVPVSKVSKLLGHANTHITSQVYVHYLPKQDDEGESAAPDLPARTPPNVP